MKLNTVWNCGNFTLEHVAEVGDKLRDVLAGIGLRSVCQRNPEIDKVLGGFETVGGKSVRRKAYKRGDVAFSPGLAARLAASFFHIRAEGIELDVATQARLYVPTDSDPKFSEEREIMARHESKSGDASAPGPEQELAVWLGATVGFEGSSHGEDGEFSLEALAAVRSFKRRMLI